MRPFFIDNFKAILDVQPNALAIHVDEKNYTYRQLMNRAEQLSIQIKALAEQTKSSYVYVLAKKTVDVYATLLAIWFCEKTYIPFHLSCALNENQYRLNLIEQSLICIPALSLDEKESVSSLLKQISPRNIIFFDKTDFEFFSCYSTGHHYYHLQSNIKTEITSPPQQDNINNPAYILFTSGTTSRSKSVAITHSQLWHYISAIIKKYQPNTNDRFIQINELTFDLSLHDILVCWQSGAALYVPPNNHVKTLKAFVNQHQITYWLSVPYLIDLFDMNHLLETDSFDSLKQSFFCGDVLLTRQAQLWQQAAVKSKITNLYGPTEATIAFTAFDYEAHHDYPDETVPIGFPLADNADIQLLNKQGELSQAQEIGEICLSGPQVISHYGALPLSLSILQYHALDSQQRGWYHTGDLARYCKPYGYIFQGRFDDQWQIQGLRIEKNDMLRQLKNILAINTLEVLAIQADESKKVIIGYALFITGKKKDINIVEKLKNHLPIYLIPLKIIWLETFPKNLNGKTDKQALMHYYKTTEE